MGIDDQDDASGISAEFLLLRPLCVAVIKDPSEKNLEILQEGLNLLEDSPPEHLSEYVLFPFILHLRQFSKLRDKIKIKLLLCVKIVLQKFQIKQWELFIEMFQRLHLAMSMSEDPTKANKELPEDLLDSILSCIQQLCYKNMDLHFKTLYEESRIKILAHSIVLTLQLSKLDVSKSIKLKSLDLILLYVSYGCDKESEAKQLFKFLPGIISSVRQIVDSRSGRIQLEIFLKGMKLLEQVIKVTTVFESGPDLAQPDLCLSVVFSEISQDVLRNDNLLFRKSLLDVSTNLLTVIAKKMPKSREILLNNVIVLKSDNDTQMVKDATNTLSVHSSYLQIGYENVIELAMNALIQLKEKDDSAFTQTLAKLSSYLEYAQLNFYELKEFLEAIFSLMTEAKSLQQYMPVKSPTIIMCSNICTNLLSIGDSNDILEVFDSKFLSFDGDQWNNFIGCVLCFNEILSKSSGKLTEVEILQFLQHYITILDIQSTEAVLNILETETPKTQSLVDVRKASLLEGLGLMAKLFPRQIIPVVLYTVVEYAGADASPIINETSRRTLSFLAEPISVRDFLHDNLDTIMNDLTVRILNLTLHPNSPNALIFLAEYFDFSQSSLVDLVDQVLSRSCDPFSGNNMQLLYSKVFYAFILSLWSQQKEDKTAKASTFLDHKHVKRKTFMEFIEDYQISLGLTTSSPMDLPNSDNEETTQNEIPTEDVSDLPKTPLTAEKNLVNKICRRVLNFLPNQDRTVRLLAMDCLIKGILILKNEEDELLPLTHITWQNLVPRITEKDHVVVRKSFELLLCLCSTAGTFLTKRTLEEIFPKLATILTDLAIESESVKEKNRKYYTYTQAYKLQLTVLQGMAEICQAIDIQEEELCKIIDGCILYLKPQQHKNLRDAASQLIDSLVSVDSSTKYKSVWMKLVVNGLKELPLKPPDPSFKHVPERLLFKFEKINK